MKKEKRNKRGKVKQTMFQRFLTKLGVNKNMATAKNYTEEMVATMTEQYTANPTRETVDRLANELGKTTRSIIAKLSREGVYVAQPRVTKAGEPVVLKGELVARIEKALGISVPSIVKATKMDLQTLADHLEAQ